MQLSPLARKKLKALAHSMKPIIITGSKGFTDALVKETLSALKIHELMKIRINAADRELRKVILQQICQACQAECVGSIGHISILYKENPDVKKYSAVV